METYLQRYEELQQERLRSRRQRASEQFFSPNVSAISDVSQLGESFDRALALFPSNRYEQDSVDYAQHYDRSPHTPAAWRYDAIDNSKILDGDGHQHDDQQHDSLDFSAHALVDEQQQQPSLRSFNALDDAVREHQRADCESASARDRASVASDEFVDAGALRKAAQALRWSWSRVN